MAQNEFALGWAGRLGGPARCVEAYDGAGVMAATNDGVGAWFPMTPEGRLAEANPVLVAGSQRLHGVKPGLLLSLACHRREANPAEPCFISGGTDHRALVFTLERKLGQLIGHENSVNSVSQAPDCLSDVVSGSYDGSAIVWRKGRKLYHLTGHQFGVEVLFLEEGLVITASGTRESGDVKIWKEGALIKEISHAHDHIIRKVAKHPLGFVTCANDGFVKVWTKGGDNLMSVLAHPPQQDTDPFVYSVAVLPSGEMVSVGEDCFVRVISTSGQIIQSIRHPAVVRDVTALPNGDFVTASTDSAIRCWTKALDRLADEATTTSFQELVQLAEASNMQTLDQNEVRDESVLQRPGNRPGQVVIVNIPGRGPIVYRWEDGAQTWQEIGEAVGQAPQRKTLDGKEYDHVVDVVLREGAPAIKLGFNKSDDPARVARAFCTRYGLGEEAIPQIIQYLQPLADPYARMAREERETVDKFKAFRFVPCWKFESFSTFITFNAQQFSEKISELNRELVASSAADALNDEGLSTLNSVANVLSVKSNFSKPETFTREMALLFHKILRWPDDKVLPALDAMRVAMIHPGGISRLGLDPQIHQRLLSIAQRGGATHVMLVCRAVCNLISKKPTEDSNPSYQEWIINILNAITMDKLTTQPAQASYSAFAHNVAIFFGRSSTTAAVFAGFPILAHRILELLQVQLKEKVAFYLLASLGTLIHIQPDLAATMKASSADLFKQITARYQQVPNESVSRAASELQMLLE